VAKHGQVRAGIAPEGEVVMVSAHTGVHIPDDVAQRVNSARDSSKPIAVAYIAPDGFPVLSLRGSVHVHSKDQLALWVRHAEGDFVRSIRENPKVSLLYRDNEDRTTYTFSGLAHIEDDEAIREKVFAASPTAEQDHDPDRKGAAVIIDLRHIEGGTVAVRGPQVLEKATPEVRIWSQLYREA
jgi:hypothetical protein